MCIIININVIINSYSIHNMYMCYNVTPISPITITGREEEMGGRASKTAQVEGATQGNDVLFEPRTVAAPWW